MSKERRVRWHAQNLAAERANGRLDETIRTVVSEHFTFEDPDTRLRFLQAIEMATHRIIRRAVPWGEGRAWLYLPSPPWRKRATTCIGVEWHAGEKHFGAHLDIGGQLSDDDFSLGLRIPLLGSLWLSIEGLTPWKWRPRADHEIGVGIHDGCVWWKLLCASNEWHSKMPFWDSRSHWRQPVWPVVDWLLGKARYSSRELSTHMAPYALPEGEYPVKITLTECTWKRARWPKPRVVRRAEIKVLDQQRPIPVPGKGENGWDCGDDALYSLTTTAATVDEALVKLHASVMRDRERYGGSTWLPQASAH
jgi:hypothetical protein